MTNDSDDPTFRPDRIGAFLPVTQFDVGVFEDILSDEVESAYTSSICCCDECYDDFSAHWPGIAFRDMEFQTQSIELSLFIEQSRIVDLYSQAELSTLKRLVSCPRCASLIWANIWIYEHRFSNAVALEGDIDALAKLGSQTPFLMLEHDFARDTLTCIREHASKVARVDLPSSLFRARSLESIINAKQLPNDILSFGPAPAEVTVEGRFNHAGSPMLYLASSAKTALQEVGMPGSEIQVAELKLNLSSLLVLDLIDLDEDLPSFEILAAVANSALLAAPRTGSGWLKKQYVFSRFVADCAKSAGFDAVRYGSTKDPLGWNYVLLEPKADVRSYASLESSRMMVL